MMKRQLILLLGFGFVLVITILLVTIYWPVSTEALNPNHGTCSICHSVHGSPGQALTNEAVVEVLCLSCHGPGGSAVTVEVHTNTSASSYPAFRMTCMDCHNPHDNMLNIFAGINLKSVGRKITGATYARISTPNSGIREVVFESRGASVGDPSLHSFADNDEDGNGTYDGACEVCHTRTRFHRNNSSGNHSHQTGRTCTNCHDHDNYFHR
jgi:predicted CXXCH cytochrome family protein